MEKVNRTFKDSVFCDLFYSDEEAKQNLLELYNGLFGTTYTDPEIIHLVRLEDAIFKNFKNDVAFTVKDQQIILGEHQSTVNPNMPLRSLMYIGREYEKIIETDARFKRSLVKIPRTFYNGTENYPAECELKLSAAFEGEETPGDSSMELTVKVININIDKKHELLEKCGKLKEYSQFTEITRNYKQDEKSMREAIRECIECGILKEYLMRKGSEVINMLIEEYSY